MDRKVFYATTRLEGLPAGQVFELVPQHPVRVIGLDGAIVTNRDNLLQPFAVGEVVQLEPSAYTAIVATMSVDGLPWPMAVEDATEPDPSAIVPAPAVAPELADEPDASSSPPVGPITVAGARSVTNGPPRAVVIAVSTPRHLQSLQPLETMVPRPPAVENADTVAHRLAQVGRVVR